MQRYFSLKFFALGSVLLAASAQAQPAVPQGVDDIGQPVQPFLELPPEKQIETNLKALLTRLNEIRPETNSANYEIGVYLSGSRVGFFGINEWTENFAALRKGHVLYLDSFKIEKLERDSAQVQVGVRVLQPNEARKMLDGEKLGDRAAAPTVETLEWRHEGTSWDKTPRWRLVPPSFKETSELGLFSLRNIAYFAGQRPGTLQQLRANIAMNRLKQAGLGVMQFVQDYDEKYIFDAEHYRVALRPYVLSEVVFSIPGGLGNFTFNNSLSDRSQADLTDIAHTVLFYEGENRKPVFRYDGKAVIAFTDGHVALLTPEEVDELRWVP